MTENESEEQAMTEDEEVTDEEIQSFLDEQKELQGYGQPMQQPKDSVFLFFRHLLGLKDTSKTGNITKDELGRLALSVRGYQNIAGYCDSVGWDEVASYMRNKGEIVLSTSLAKEGFLDTLFVTQIKKEQKLKPKQEVKQGWFQKKQNAEE